MDNEEDEKRSKAIMAAHQIATINSILQVMDWDFLSEGLAKTREQASRYDTFAVLNRGWNPHHGKTLSVKANALQKLIEYHDLLIECDGKSRTERKYEEQIDTLKNLFG